MESILHFIISHRRSLETQALITRVSTTEVKGVVHRHVQLTAVFQGTLRAVEDGHSSVVTVPFCPVRAI